MFYVPGRNLRVRKISNFKKMYVFCLFLNKCQLQMNNRFADVQTNYQISDLQINNNKICEHNKK